MKIEAQIQISSIPAGMKVICLYLIYLREVCQLSLEKKKNTIQILKISL